MTWYKLGKGLLIAFAWTVASGLYLFFAFVVIIMGVAVVEGLIATGILASIVFVLKGIGVCFLALIAMGIILASHTYVADSVEEFFKERKRNKIALKKEEQDG